MFMMQQLWSFVVGLQIFFAAMPGTSNYQLNSYGFGSGGSAGSSTENYSAAGVTGELSGQDSSTGNYSVKSGLVATQQSNVPMVSASNDSNFYNKLKLTLDPQSSPSDATFAIAVSQDNFSTTQYVQSDSTVGSALGTEDYQTFNAWGGLSGFFVIGLNPGTTYSFKVSGMHGKFSESGFGPVASAATSSPSLTFDIDVSASDTETSPPFAISFSDLLPGSVVESTSKLWIDLESNGETGGRVYIAGQNVGLKSTKVAYTIASASGDLDSKEEGFGAQSIGTAQVSGGPLLAVAPYDGSGSAVGLTDISVRNVYSSAAPITGGRGQLILKAKAASGTPVASDYTEVITLIAAAAF